MSEMSWEGKAPSCWREMLTMISGPLSRESCLVLWESHGVPDTPPRPPPSLLTLLASSPSQASLLDPPLRFSLRLLPLQTSPETDQPSPRPRWIDVVARRRDEAAAPDRMRFAMAGCHIKPVWTCSPDSMLPGIGILYHPYPGPRESSFSHYQRMTSLVHGDALPPSAFPCRVSLVIPGKSLVPS